MNQPSHKTELVDRTLWYDGDSTVATDKIVELISTGMPVEGMFVEQLTADIKRYNQYVEGDEKITIKKGIDPLKFDWNIPKKFLTLNVEGYIRNKLSDEGVVRGWLNPDDHKTRMMGPELEARFNRVREELDLYETLGLTDVLRVLIYVINTLQTRDVVWGVGRGSSVSSYVLYLIGVHDIDSVDHELDITDFLRDEGSSGEK